MPWSSSAPQVQTLKTQKGIVRVSNTQTVPFKMITESPLYGMRQTSKQMTRKTTAD